jgi:hypothetical protein
MKWNLFPWASAKSFRILTTVHDENRRVNLLAVKLTVNGTKLSLNQSVRVGVSGLTRIANAQVEYADQM